MDMTIDTALPLLTEDGLRPSATWLNGKGEIKICWEDSNREQVLALIREKMRAGTSFYIIRPRKLAILGHKKVKVKTEADLQSATGVVLEDKNANAFLADLSDKVLNAAHKAGVIELARDEKPGVRAIERSTGKRATTAEEVIRNQTVAIPVIVGG